MPERARQSLVLAFSKRPMAANTDAPDLVRMRNLLAKLMTGYKRNRRHWRSRALYGPKGE